MGIEPTAIRAVREVTLRVPVGMYAACSFVVGGLTQRSAIVDFARVWVWVAVAVWLAVFPAMLASARGLVGSGHRDPPLTM